MKLMYQTEFETFALQGTVATRLRGSGIFIDQFVADVLFSILAKEFRKSIYI